ncbi:MAG: hypothetical protein LBH85_00885 [Treponema sp.]|jgi:hypothetical protein|nr:hypothetical protein [Treponema sp.]
MRGKLIAPVLALYVWSAAAAPVFADAGRWEARERGMRLVLSGAYYRFVAADIEVARAPVDRAYYAEHCHGDFERNVRGGIFCISFNY